MRRLLLVFAVLGSPLLASGCTGDLPIGPSPIPTSGPTWWPISGIVNADAAPVAGARILVFSDSGVKPSTTTTDELGIYTLEDVGPVDCPAACAFVSASKPGFFTDIKYAETARDGRLDFELDPLVYVSVGEVINGYAGEAGDAQCSGLGYGSSPCQRFAIVATSSGVLQISSPGPFNFDFDVVKPDGTFAIYSPGSQAAFSRTLDVIAGATYELRIVQTFTDSYFQFTTDLR